MIPSKCFEFFFCNSVFMIPKTNGKWRRIDDLTHCWNRACPRFFAPNYFSDKMFLPVRFASIKDAIASLHLFPGRIM